MVRARKRGSVGIITTKSITRFSRNTLDLLKVCRDLNALNIDICFQIENMRLLDIDTILSQEIYTACAPLKNKTIAEVKISNGVLEKGSTIYCELRSL